MPRLFVGLALPSDVRLRLSIVGGPLAGARWVEPESLHVTLRFAGDIDNRQADEFVGFLDEIAIEPFEIGIREVGCFGGREPKVIYAGVEGPPALGQLQRAVERAARSAGLAPDSRPFRPHVTLARLKGAHPDVIAGFLGARASLVIAPFALDRFVLFSSRPRVGGGPYVIESEFPLD